jgi:hypothetical protein
MFESSNHEPILARRATSNIQNISSKLGQAGSGNLTGGLHKTPALPRRVDTDSAAMAQPGSRSTAGVSLPGLGQQPPALPTRNQASLQKAAIARKPVANLLEDDEVHGDMGGWETLKPN